MKIMIKLILFVFLFLLFSFIPIALYNSSPLEAKTPAFLVDLLSRTEAVANQDSLMAFIDTLVAQIRSLL